MPRCDGRGDSLARADRGQAKPEPGGVGLEREGIFHCYADN